MNPRVDMEWFNERMTHLFLQEAFLIYLLFQTLNISEFLFLKIFLKSSNYFIGDYTKLNVPMTYEHCSKIKFSIKDQIRRKLRIWSHLLKKYLIKKLHFLCSGRSRRVNIRKLIS